MTVALDAHGAAPPSGAAPWVALEGTALATPDPDVQLRRIWVMAAAGAVVSLVMVGVGGVLAAHKLAEYQAVNDAANTADLLAEAVVQPSLRDGIESGRSAPRQRLAAALRPYLASSDLVRVKLWSRDGRVLYSDEPRLIGRRFGLSGEELAVFSRPRTQAEVSDLRQPENLYERGRGQLLEAYRPVWTPSGTPMLFEIYSPLTEVNARAGQMWRGFAGVTLSTLMLFVVLLAPVFRRLLTGLRNAGRQRETLLRRSVDASGEERRRIAATLHDGAVQQLVGTSLSVTGAAGRARALGADDLGSDLEASAATVRDSIRSLRTLLVDIYPPSLTSAGLVPVLRDAAAGLRSRAMTVHLDFPAEDPGLGPLGDRGVFRVVHEILQNVVRHSSASTVWLSLEVGTDAVVVEVTDDGVGFDPVSVLAGPADGHFGLRLLGDHARSGDALLMVASAPGAGCRWRLRVPR